VFSSLISTVDSYNLTSHWILCGVLKDFKAATLPPQKSFQKLVTQIKGVPTASGVDNFSQIS
jgi:hypothetical protein